MGKPICKGCGWQGTRGYIWRVERQKGTVYYRRCKTCGKTQQIKGQRYAEMLDARASKKAERPTYSCPTCAHKLRCWSRGRHWCKVCGKAYSVSVLLGQRDEKGRPIKSGGV